VRTYVIAAREDLEVARGVDAWWRANNYLTVGQIYLQATRCCASR
jgi:xylulose-5-phosphate/fructose-6-phosphate phosphoketolase